MYKKVGFIVGSLLLLMVAACGDKVDEEIDILFETLGEDQSVDSLVELLEAAHDQEPYEDQLNKAKTDTDHTAAELNSLNLSTDRANELRELYVSSLDDFHSIIGLIETNGPDLTEENWSEIESISAEANEKQMELVREKFQRMDMEIPDEVKKQVE